jgi:hypothetical protein
MAGASPRPFFCLSAPKTDKSFLLLFCKKEGLLFLKKKKQKAFASLGGFDLG